MLPKILERLTQERPPQRVPWRVALPWVVALAATFDLLLGQRPTFVATLSAFGLGLGAGFVAGAILDLVSFALHRAPGWLARSPWLLPGLAAGWWLASELGVFARLDGPYRNLALLSLAAASAGGAVLGATFAALQPTKKHPHGWLCSRPVLRWVVTALFLLGTVALTYVDRRMFVELYPSAHLALQVISLWALAAILVNLGPVPGKLRKPRAIVFAVATLLALLPFVLLRDSDDPSISRLTQRPFASLALEVQRALTDVDRDGYSSLLGGGDCAAWNTAVNPGAVEIPDNGIDDNCRYGDRVTVVVDDSDEVVPEVDGPVPNVVVITLDAVVPHHMSVYGYERDTTPNLKRFAKDAVVFHRAYTPATWTSLAIPALLRGTFPRRMRWTRVGETNRYRLLRVHEFEKLGKGERLRMMFGLPLEEPRVPFPKRLQDVGYHTIASLDDGYSQFLSKKAGLDEGFSDFRHVDGLARDERNDVGNTKLALQALRVRPKDKPFLLWIHYFGPHDPSTKRTEVPSYGSSVADLYDHEIRYADHALGPLLEELDSIGNDRPLAVIVTADHGELLLEERRLHGSGLHEITTRIPMIAKLPGVTPGRSDALVSLVDIPVTILRMAGARGSASMDGLDLREILAGRGPERRILHSDTWRFKENGDAWYDISSVYDGEYKLVFYRHVNQMRLKRQDDLARPPTNLIDTMPVPAHLDEAMGAYMEHTGGPPTLHD